MRTDAFYLDKCLRQCEAKLHLGDSNNWRNQDFEMVSDQLFDETGIQLSPSTLKRVWGKVKYESKPNITTLNTLAKFIGYENWRTFKDTHSQPCLTSVTNIDHKKDIHLPVQEFRSGGILRYRLILLFIIIVGLFLTGVIFLGFAKKSKVLPDKSKIEFNSTKVVTEGVPNSVIFNYKITGATENDSIIIQQSWDKTKRQKVSHNGRQATTIYYYPGFFKAKLLLNNEIVREQDVLIRTTGWLGLVEKGPEVPIYFKQQQIFNEGKLFIPSEKLKAAGVSLPNVPVVGFYNVQDFNGIRSDDFTFEAELKNEFGEGSAVCQKTTIILFCEDDFISIPLAAKGCVSSINLSFLGERKDGSKADLSAFGGDLDNWVKLKCTVKKDIYTIMMNDVRIYEGTLQKPVSKRITGIVFKFEGNGSVNFTRLIKTSDSVGYEYKFGD